MRKKLKDVPKFLSIKLVQKRAKLIYLKCGSVNQDYAQCVTGGER